MFELHHDEKVILYIRRHWIFLFLQTKVIFLIFITPVALVWAAQYFSWVPDINLFGVSIYSLTDILIYLWGLFCWMLLAEKFTDYALDFWVVTNKRIIESELIKLFDVRLSTLELQDIEDITVHSEGFWANLIGFGRLDVQTAGTRNEFYAENIMDPAHVQKTIFEAKLAHEREVMDIEKQEFEQISERVYKENEAQKADQNTEFDWAHERAEVEKETGPIEDYYKKDIENALKSGE
jgi:hypothetical protein